MQKIIKEQCASLIKRHVMATVIGAFLTAVFAPLALWAITKSPLAAAIGGATALMLAFLRVKGELKDAKSKSPYGFFIAQDTVARVKKRLHGNKMGGDIRYSFLFHQHGTYNVYKSLLPSVKLFSAKHENADELLESGEYGEGDAFYLLIYERRRAIVAAFPTSAFEPAPDDFEERDGIYYVKE